MKTAYKIPSSFQPGSLTITGDHPSIRSEINRNLGNLSLSVEIQEDVATAELLRKQAPGVIAFLARLKNGNGVISEGRGLAVLGHENNRFFGRAIRWAANSAVIDSVSKGIKLLDSIRFEPTQDEENKMLADGYQEMSANEPSATEKQRSFLTELVFQNLDGEEREQWLSQIGNLSRKDASEAIQSFVRP